MADTPTTPTSTGPLDPKLLQMFQDIAANPTDIVVGQFRGYLEDFIRLTMGSQKNWTPPIGSPLTVFEDLTAQTGEYVYTDEFGVQYLYANGVAVSQTTYAALYAAWGPNKWGADSGGNFLLPDCRGRTIGFCGTHADTDLGDNDGETVENRRMKHAHSTDLSITGAPGIGSLTLQGAPGGTFGSSTHTHDITTANVQIPSTGPPTNVANHQVYTSTGPSATASPTIGTLALNGAPSAGTLDVDGTVGVGGTDTPAHIYIGSLLVRF